MNIKTFRDGKRLIISVEYPEEADMPTEEKLLKGVLSGILGESPITSASDGYAEPLPVDEDDFEMPEREEEPVITSGPFKGYTESELPGYLKNRFKDISGKEAIAKLDSDTLFKFVKAWRLVFGDIADITDEKILREKAAKKIESWR